MSYTGEVIETAHPLTLEQALPAVPKPEHGAMVNLVDVLPREMIKVVEAPEKLVLAEPQGLP